MANKKNEAKADAQTYFNLGLAYNELELYDNALMTFQQALKLARKSEDYPRIVECLLQISTVYENKANIKKALSYARKTFKVVQEHFGEPVEWKFIAKRINDLQLKL